jgi:glycosyltransferase involved in cell wall biosynthesis
MKQRIALVGFGHFSLANPSLTAALREEFADAGLHWVDAGGDVKGLAGSWRNWLEATREFGGRSRGNPRAIRQYLSWTTHLFESRSRAARRRVEKGGYACTIQTQSHYDARVEGIPHFVYSDNTMLANLQYPDLRFAFPAGTVASGQELPVTGAWLAAERRLYRGAAACFVMSENVRRSLDVDYGCAQDRIITAYAGSNLPVSHEAAVSPQPGNILWVGVEWERKGGPQLVEAFRLLRRDLPHATLTIVGCSPDLIEPGCRVAGRIPAAQLPLYYDTASVFCLPTRHEPFGFVFAEAMAHGLPVVATDIGAIPDMVINGENGYRVPPGDPIALAGALRRILADPGSRERMGSHSRRIGKKYTWRNTASIMGAAIRRLVPAVRGHAVAS